MLRNHVNNSKQTPIVFLFYKNNLAFNYTNLFDADLFRSAINTLEKRRPESFRDNMVHISPPAQNFLDNRAKE